MRFVYNRSTCTDTMVYFDNMEPWDFQLWQNAVSMLRIYNLVLMSVVIGGKPE